MKKFTKISIIIIITMFVMSMLLACNPTNEPSGDGGDGGSNDGGDSGDAGGNEDPRIPVIESVAFDTDFELIEFTVKPPTDSSVEKLVFCAYPSTDTAPETIAAAETAGVVDKEMEKKHFPTDGSSITTNIEHTTESGTYKVIVFAKYPGDDETRSEPSEDVTIPQ